MLWKRKLKNELKNAVPPLSEKVLAEAIPTPPSEAQNPVKQTKTMGFYPKRLVAGLCCIAVLFVAVLSGVLLIPKGGSRVTAFAVDVNPSALFTVGKDGLVNGVVAKNSDADVILASEERVGEMLGVTPERATEIFLDYSARLGFIDFDNRGVVKLTVCGEVNGLTDAVQGYFKDKGGYYAVLKEDVDAPEFCEKNGLSLQDSVGNIVDFVSKMPILFSEREVIGKTLDEVQELYGERIEKGDYKDFYESVISKHLDEIESRAIAIEEIGRIYDKIYNNEETLLKDYWSIIKVSFVEYSEEFNALLDEMSVALEDYAERFGKEISDLVELSRLRFNYSSERIASVRSVVEDFYKFFSTETLALIEELFKDIGVEINFLTTLPKSVEEYVKQVKEIIPLEFTNKVNEHLENYAKQREKVTDEGYDNFIKDIIVEFGSIEGFWNEINK